MPIGEVIGEIILRPILELVFYGICYWTGFILIKFTSLGRIKLAPLHTIHEKNRNKKKWYQVDSSIWLSRPMQRRALKAEFTCLLGMIIWITLGVVIYFGSP